MPQPSAAGDVDRRLTVLLVEDDAVDEVLVREWLAETGAAVELRVATGIDEAVDMFDGVDCVLLDLLLPGMTGLDALHRLVPVCPTAICVLTGLADEAMAAAAVAAGAQDYLVKDRVEGRSLYRAIRYAVQRHAAEESDLRLREAELRQAESTRLERGLMPQFLLHGAPIELHPYYQTGRRRSLLGGDFYDAVLTGPHRLSLLVGDVCGHGPREAALGAQLRVAWRALTLAGVAESALVNALDQVLASERHNDEVFTTLATATVDLAARTLSVRCYGHPAPILIRSEERRVGK